MKNEEILVVKSELLPLDKFKKKKFVNFDNKNKCNEDYLMQWLVNGEYMKRDEAETNPDFKQFIPYCVIKKDGKYFCYKRTKKGGESRLHDLWSVGVGGHVNRSDATHPEEAFTTGLARELEEEIGLKTDQFAALLHGFIYDDSNEVGKVHLGIVYVIEVDEDAEVAIKDEALSKGSFETLESMKEKVESFETWSQIIIKAGILV